MRGELRAVITTDALELGIDIGAARRRASSSRSPAPSPRCARCGAAPGARSGAGAAWPCTSPARTRSTSSSAATPTSSSSARSRRRSSTTRAPLIYRQHLLCAAHEGPLSQRRTPSSSARAGRPTPSCSQSAGELRRRRQAARSDRGDATSPRRPGALSRRRGLAALGLAGELRDRRRLLGRAARLDRGRARALDRARGRHLPAPRALLRGARARPRAPARARRAVRRRLVHAAQARDRHRHRAPARPPRGARRDAVLRRGQRHRDRARLPAQAPGRPRASSTWSRSTCRRRASPTQALWFELDAARAAPSEIPLEALLGALHATEHAQIAVLPLIAMCDRWDIGGLSTNFHPQTGAPTIFIYDGHPGGIGIARTAFARFEELCADAHAPDRRVPVRERLPLVRAVAEVRQPQRAAVQGGRAARCSSACSPSAADTPEPAATACADGRAL